MQQKLLVFLVLAALNVALIQAEFSRADFETCYFSCRSSFKTSAFDQSAPFTPTGYTGSDTPPFDRQYFYERMFKYEKCVLGLSKETFKQYYAPADITAADIVSADTNIKQTSYCSYFFSSIYDASKINQNQLKTLASNCFREYNGQCGDYLPGVSNAEADGSTHYADAFGTCIQNCEEQTAIEALLEYNNCSGLCLNTFDAETGGDSGAELTQYEKYQDCKRTSQNCGQLESLTMEDFAYKAIWTKCENECQGVYKADDDSTNVKEVARVAYFDCINGCPIPSADSFQRLDNSVELGSSNLIFSFGLLLVIAQVLLL